MKISRFARGIQARDFSPVLNPTDLLQAKDPVAVILAVLLVYPLLKSLKIE